MAATQADCGGYKFFFSMKTGTMTIALDRVTTYTNSQEYRSR